MKKLFIIAFLIFLIQCLWVLAAGSEDRAKSKPLTIDQKREVNELIASYKNTSLYDKIQCYIAVRKDDPRICQSTLCRKTFEEVSDQRYLAENRCNKIPEEVNPAKEKTAPSPLDALHVDFCNAQILLMKNPTEKTEKIFDAAYKKRDIQALSLQPNEIKDRDSFYKKFKIKTAREKQKDIDLADLGIIWGFKYHNSFSACQKYLDQVEITRRTLAIIDHLSCEILFYPDLDHTIYDILKDLALFEMARKHRDNGFCQSIRHDKIKQACLNPKFADLIDLM